MIGIEHFARLAKDFWWVDIKITPKHHLYLLKPDLEKEISKGMGNHMLNENSSTLKTKTIAGNNTNNSNISRIYKILTYSAIIVPKERPPPLIFILTTQLTSSSLINQLSYEQAFRHLIKQATRIEWNVFKLTFENEVIHVVL